MARRPRFTVTRLSHPRRARIACRMRAAGLPVFAIVRALKMPRERVLAALAGSALWSQSQRALFKEIA